MFMEHIKGAYNAGLKVGIYMFTEAVNAKEGKEEAQYAISLMKKAGVPLSYPIGIDSEDVFYKENDNYKELNEKLNMLKSSDNSKQI